MLHHSETEIISQKLQQGMADWNPSPLVPKAFQKPVQSAALNQAIDDIAALARKPLEDALRCQQERIAHLEALVQRLERSLDK